MSHRTHVVLILICQIYKLGKSKHILQITETGGGGRRELVPSLCFSPFQNPCCATTDIFYGELRSTIL